ncbi:pro-resilin-like [Panulirus ornatus]|uniref:pro-resilin-like n=1 Tax=Panulirus ornatus TaxID=150431 RepID=UPI003A864741
MTCKILLLAGLVALATAAKLPSFRSPLQVGSGELGPSQYKFNWSVHGDDDNSFGQQEVRDGYHTQGSYSVHLPDGRLLTVTYYVDGDSGFVAELNYEGEARYD